MGRYVVKRILGAAVLLVAISIIVFALIQLPPGDFLSTHIEQMKMEGTPLQEAEIQNLTREYHLDEPVPVQYLMWVKNIVTKGSLGRSFTYGEQVTEVLADRIAMTVFLSLLTIFFTWLIAFPTGVIAALRQYSWFDYLFSLIGFIGVSIPGFMLALVGVYVIFKTTGFAINGLFSTRFLDQPMSLAKFGDLLGHIWFPVIVIGLHGTASLVRAVRGQVLDELGKQYIVAAKARGVSGARLLFAYPIRVAVNPLISTIGWMLPAIISGESIVAVVLNLQTVGPVLLKSLQTQDMYLAGSILLITGSLTLVGTLISDILLALLDPRIRIGGNHR